jgi:hypothetical protein
MSFCKTKENMSFKSMHSVKTVVFSARKIQQMYPIKPAEREDSRVKARKEVSDIHLFSAATHIAV